MNSKYRRTVVNPSLKAQSGRWLFIGAAISLFSLSSFGIEVKPPQNWVMPANMMPGVVKQYVSQSAQNGFSSNLVITRGPMPCCREESTTPESLMAKVANQQSRVLPQYKILEYQKRRIDGKEGGFMVSSYARGEDDLACFQFFYLDGQDFVNVVYTSLLKDLPRLRPEFENSLATLKVGTEKAAAGKP